MTIVTIIIVRSSFVKMSVLFGLVDVSKKKLNHITNLKITTYLLTQRQVCFGKFKNVCFGKWSQSGLSATDRVQVIDWVYLL